MAGRYSGQRALVTGASSGIGLELARRLAEEGAHLVLVARRRDRLEALAEELRGKHGVEVRVEVADLEAPGAAADLHARVEAAGLAIDILVNNAGFGEYKPFAEVPWSTWAGMIQVNVLALVELSYLFVAPMLARGRGHVMNVASMGAWTPAPTFAIYTATKAFVLGFTEAFDCEIAPRGVRAIAVCPGGTATEFMDRSHQNVKPSAMKMLMSSRACADWAVDAMLRGKRVVVTGWFNLFVIFLLRFVPRWWLPKASGKVLAMAMEKSP